MVGADLDRDDHAMSDQQESTTQTNSSGTGVAARRLVRRPEGKWIAGVATGLGDYTGLDPVIFRIAFVLLSVAGGVGVLLYGLAWAFIPSADTGESVGENAFRRAGKRSSTVFGLLLLLAGAAWILGDAGIWEPEIIWAVALIAIGIILLRDDDAGPQTTRTPAAATSPPAAAVTAPQQALAERPEPVRARRKRQRSFLGRLTVGATLLLLGTTAVLDNLGAFDASVDAYFALAIAGIGAGLVVGAWRGRSRGLIFLGVVLLPLLFVSSLIDVPFEGGVGDRYYSPASAIELRDSYRLAAGVMIIDLTDVAAGADDVDVAATVGTGNLEVQVPREVGVTVEASSGAGVVEVFGRSQGGIDVSLNHSTGNELRGKITLNLDVGLGAIWVERAGELPRTDQGAS
jgi:phage shock protein PspC (stress-responsive transcriptional regulator)